jgi:hypothetical protein
VALLEERTPAGASASDAAHGDRSPVT